MGARRTRGEGGFSLVEVLVVIGIIAVLIAILVPALGGVRVAARVSTTSALMRDVSTAVQQFKLDTGRNPGVFNSSAMGSDENLIEGFTTAENILLDLAGGLVDDVEASAVDNQQGGTGFQDQLIKVGPLADDAQKRVVLPSLIGSQDGPGYFTVREDVVRPVVGQRTTSDGYDGLDLLENASGVKAMPDIVDAFGMPLLMWSQDRAPRAAIQNVDEFAQIDTTGDRAAFYWTSNAAYLDAGFGATDPSTVPTSIGLGEQSINVRSESLLGSQLDEDARRNNLAAILGSPTSPSTDQRQLPVRARSEIVIISAGPDRLWFKGDQAGPSTLMGFGADGLQPGGAGTETGPTVDDGFDDIVEGVGS